MADDIEVTVVLTDEEIEAYRAWRDAPRGEVRTSSGLGLLALLMNQLEDALVEACSGDEADPEEEEDNTCPLCIGTGIPQSGPPDVGHCSACGGSGVKKREPCEDDFDPPDSDEGPWDYNEDKW